MIEQLEKPDSDPIAPRNPIHEWTGAIKEEVSEWSVALIFGVILLCLVAPLFGPFIEESLMQKYDADQFPSRRPIVYEKMKRVKVWLWLAAITGWIGIFVIGVTWNWQY